MTGFNIKKEYDDQDFSPISEGWHMCQVDRAILTETGPNSKSPGTPMLALQYRMLSPHADRNKTCRDYVMLVDEFYGYGKLSKLCLAIDPNMASSSNSSDGIDPHDQASIFKHILGGIMNVKIFHKKHGDKTYANANGYGYAEPNKKQGVFAEIGGEPSLGDEAYCDFEGVSLNKPKGSDSDDPWGYSGNDADGNIPF